MGMLLRNRILLHLTHGESFFRPRPCQSGPQNFSHGNFQAALGYASLAAENSDDQSSSSWFQKLKGVFKGKTTSSETTPSAASGSCEFAAATATEGDLTMESKSFYYYLLNYSIFIFIFDFMKFSSRKELHYEISALGQE